LQQAEENRRIETDTSVRMSRPIHPVMFWFIVHTS